MDDMMGRARFLGRAAVLGAAALATLLAAGMVGVADAAQTAATTASARTTTQGATENFNLPAGVDAVKVASGRTQLTVTRSAGVTPNTSIPCTLTISNPAYYTGSGGSGVQATGTIRCAYPTDLFLQVGLSYNGNTPVYKGQGFSSTWVASVTVTTSAAPGYYQANAISVLGNGQQYGTYYSSNVYIPQ